MTEQVVQRTMTPFGDTIICEPLPDFDPSSRIILPEGSRVRYDRAKRAKIVDVGPDVYGLLPGMEVLVKPMHDGVEIDVPGTGRDTGRFRVFQAQAVVAVLSKDPTPDALLGAIERVTGEFYRTILQFDEHRQFELLSDMHAAIDRAIAREFPA